MSETIDKLIDLARDVSARTGFASNLLRAVKPASVQPLWHPLGFAHMRLAEESGRVLRLHVWSKAFAEPMDPLWPVHDHVFTLASLVVSGSIRDLRYDVRMSDCGDKQLYEVIYGDTGSIRRRTEKRVSCVLRSDSVHSAGTAYKVEAGNFHSSELASGKAAVTLVVTSGADAAFQKGLDAVQEKSRLFLSELEQVASFDEGGESLDVKVQRAHDHEQELSQLDIFQSEFSDVREE
jgi:hypothetical protein